MKRRPVFFSPEAREDLFWISDTVSAATNPVTAGRYLDRLEAFCDNLEFASERGSLHQGIRQGLRIVGFERRVTVAFIVEADRVSILRLFYGGAKWEDELRGN